MDIILIIKSFFIGFTWGGSLYMILGYCFTIFPLPALFNIYKKLYSFAARKQAQDAAKGAWYFAVNAKIVLLLAFLLWMSIIALFLYTLYPILGDYILFKNPFFWVYFGIAAALPSLFILVQAIQIIRRGHQRAEENEKELREVAGSLDKKGFLLDIIREGAAIAKEKYKKSGA